MKIKGEFFNHVLHSIKTKDQMLRLFLKGGAGVGRSTVINALYEALIKHLNAIEGENPDNVKVVKTAPTGKQHSTYKVTCCMLLLRDACQWRF